MSGLTIGVGALRGKSAHRKMMENLLGSAGVGRCPGLSNGCTFGLSNQQDGRYIPATDLELIRFMTLLLGEIVWHLSTHVNDSDISS